MTSEGSTYSNFFYTELLLDKVYSIKLVETMPYIVRKGTNVGKRIIVFNVILYDLPESIFVTVENALEYKLAVYKDESVQWDCKKLMKTLGYKVFNKQELNEILVKIE